MRCTETTGILEDYQPIICLVSPLWPLSSMYRTSLFRTRYFYRGHSFARSKLRRKPAKRYVINPDSDKGSSSANIPDASIVASVNNVQQMSVDPENGQFLGTKNDKSLVKTKPPRLTHDLARVLYQPLTLHQLQDSRTGVYNFEPELEMIAPDMLEPKDDGELPFITPHKDETLHRMAKISKSEYVSSTSSMTSSLSQLHFLLSGFRPLNAVDLPLSRRFPDKHLTYTQGAKLPASFILRKLDDKVTSIDSDKSLDREIVLSILGHSLEEFLTDRAQSQPESYHYSQVDSFLLRSQLDAYDSKLPGTGVFDLKTRAVAAIRHDLSFVESNNNYTGYEIDRVFGEFESLEREFFELVRSTLLKYSLQARIGKMDGIFVAYHNIARMFGFQYLPLEDLDFIIHSCYDSKFNFALSSKNHDLRSIYGDQVFFTQQQRDARKVASAVADKEFKISIHLFKNILMHVKNLLNSKGIKNWQKCKIMMQTVTSKDTNGSKSLRSVEKPVLKVVAVPLPDDYEDKPLLTKDMDNNAISQQLAHIREENQQLLENLGDSIVGFQIKVSHEYRESQKKELKIPGFARPSQKVLTPESCDYVIAKLNQDYYRNFKNFKYPSFFHPKDLAGWKVRTQIYNINSTEQLKSLYGTFLNQKLHVLEEQSVIISTNRSSNKEVSRRISDLMAEDFGGKVEKKDGQELSALKSRLRAYAKKGETRRKLRDRLCSPKVKITWDSQDMD
ncbi:ZYRO0G01320p [Zygosaccharomyces rouxii]|uniref:ZYRO0G01320p n=1 Tax=Zygosaccharomyces rouxii (strain ATCC 2623 / CBS 732 / NBRC 1130 / NCYC 568 / NRRL Y-229) TaxID=559307 RepID=C5E1T5_ZYGRC|nr:uncharacterized protein ZYRO0G01320g [Zygosaccharomyces rouxii]KAH9202126.1 mitochondrial protein Pet127-domain-containing protein [Zygosaccharomyces rouxii]CAR29128.1 ZYRO0G01320p [Zygosaccharomyces rouxii]